MLLRSSSWLARVPALRAGAAPAAGARPLFTGAAAASHRAAIALAALSGCTRRALLVSPTAQAAVGLGGLLVLHGRGGVARAQAGPVFAEGGAMAGVRTSAARCRRHGPVCCRQGI